MKSYLRQSASALRSVGCASRSLAISAQRQFGAAAAPGSVGAESFRVSAIAGAAMVSFAATSLVVPNSGVIMAAPAVALPGVASVWKKRAVGEMPIRTDLAAADDDEDDEEEEEAEDQEEELKDGQEEAAAQREVVQEGGKEEGPTAESEEERDQAVASDPETPAPEETQEQEPAVVLEVEEEDSKAVGPAGKTTVDEEGGPEVVAEEVQQEEPVPAEHKSVPEEQEKVEVASAVVVTEEKGEPNIPAPERDSEDPRYDGYIAIYLDAESQATLREKFPPRHATRGADRVLLVAKPNSDEYNEASDSFAKEIELNALVYVETDASQILIVDIDDESVRKVVEPSSLPHVTLSTATEGPGAATALEVAVARAAAGPEAAAKAAAGDAAEADTVSTILDASAVLARLQSRSVLTAMGVEESVEINSQAGATKAPRLTVPAGGAAWHGVLPATEMGAPATDAEARTLDPLRLRGTVCRSEDWNSSELKCERPKCAFCVFMESGPCGEEFKVWEDCVDRIRSAEEAREARAKSGKELEGDEEGGEDFVTACGEYTLKLKECVDANPEYYGSLGTGNPGGAAEE